MRMSLEKGTPSSASLADRRVSVTTVVQVAYGTDLQAVMPRLQAVVAQVPRVIQEPAPSVLLTQFAADGLELTVSFWIIDPEIGQMGVRSADNLALLAELDRLGVEIPFPQRVLRPVATAPCAATAGVVSSPAP